MKITLILAGLMILLAPLAKADISLSATQSSQTVAAGGTFNITLQLNITQSSNPDNVAGYDVVFETADMQNGNSTDGLFTITSASAPPAQPNWSVVGPGYPDVLTAAKSDNSGLVQSSDEGFGGDNSSSQSITTPVSDFQLATYTFTLANDLAPGTYNFDTTLQASSLGHFSDVADMSGSIFPVDNGATFQVTVASIPEPSSWALEAMGLFTCLAVYRIRKFAATA